jgi:hypothetical protein
MKWPRWIWRRSTRLTLFEHHPHLRRSVTELMASDVPVRLVVASLHPKCDGRA